MNKWVLHHGLLSKASSLLGSKRKKHKYLLRVDGQKKGEYIYFYTQKEVDAYYQKKREERAEKVKDFAVNAVKKVGGAIDNAITENYKQALSDLAEEGRSLGPEARAAKEKFKKYINFKDKVKDVVDKVQIGKNISKSFDKAPITTINTYNNANDHAALETAKKEVSSAKQKQQDARKELNNMLGSADIYTKNKRESIKNNYNEKIDKVENSIFYKIFKSLKNKKIESLKKEKTTQLGKAYAENEDIRKKYIYSKDYLHADGHYLYTLDELRRMQKIYDDNNKKEDRNNFLKGAKARANVALFTELKQNKIDLEVSKLRKENLKYTFDKDAAEQKVILDNRAKNIFTDKYIKTTFELTPGMKLVPYSGNAFLYDNNNGGTVTRLVNRHESDEVGKLPRISGQETHDESQEAVNPDYDPYDVRTYTNCQYSSSAYIMRRKGYDVEAELNLGDDVYKGTRGAESYRFDGETMLSLKPVSTANEAREKIAEQALAFGEGSYGTLSVSWRGMGYGHSVVWEVEKGELIIRDTQTGFIYKNAGIDDFLEPSAYNITDGIIITRLDNAMPNNFVLESIKKRGT